MKKQPLIAIIGPTASGKSRLGIALAKNFNGYVISADSRQLYRGMDIATAKEKGVIKTWHGLEAHMVDDVPHFMINIINPDDDFTVAEYQDRVNTIIATIHKSDPGAIPFLVGGTGLYVQAIIDNLDIPRGKPNKGLRAELEGYEIEELFDLLKEKDPETAKTIQKDNRRRLIRALEVVLGTGESFIKQQKRKPPLYETLQIGLKLDKEELNKRINARVKTMFEEGIVDEAKALLKNYRIESSSMTGIGYPEIAQALEGQMTMDEAQERIKINTRQYARKQMQWFKRDTRIQWISDPEQAWPLVEQFLKK